MTTVRLLGRGLFIAVGLSLLLALLASAGVAQAHGKEVKIAVSCAAPDPARPLTKVCTAFLKYVDGDPVPKASLQLTAVREGKDEPAVGPVVFKPLDQEGVYSATVTFPAYGKWRMRFRVQEPGEGEAELREEFLPPLPGAAPELRAQLQIILNFGLIDLRNIALRTIHLLAAIAWFAVIAFVLVLSRFTAPEQRWRLLRRGAIAFPWAIGGTLLLVAITGIYNAMYNVPTRSPGIFAPEVFARLPFGEAYLAAFFVKMGLMVAILGATVALAAALRGAYGRPVPGIAGAAPGSSGPRHAPDQQVTWLAVLNLVLGLLTFANVVVLGYLHIISHVAAAAGAR